MGMIKSGGNYASALQPTMQAKAKYQADQVLFCPNGDVQETGAANFLLIDGNEIITKALDTFFPAWCHPRHYSDFGARLRHDSV